MANNHKPTSRYVNTPNKDYYLDLWNPVTIDASANDIVLTISSAHDKRPDLLSASLYGTPRYWWVFAIRNKNILIDPIFDFKAGTVISVPTKDRIEAIL